MWVKAESLSSKDSISIAEASAVVVILVMKIIFYLFIFHERIRTSIHSSIHCLLWVRTKQKKYHRIMFLWMRNIFSKDVDLKNVRSVINIKTKIHGEQKRTVSEWKKGEEENHKKKTMKDFRQEKWNLVKALESQKMYKVYRPSRTFRLISLEIGCWGGRKSRVKANKKNTKRENFLRRWS